MLELVFVRHGETDENRKGAYCGWTDAALNPDGVKQANEAAHRLDGIKARAVLTSPLKRARETAEIIGKRLNLEITCCDSLKERNFGIWENLTYGEIAAEYPIEHDLWARDWVNYAIIDGESALQAYDRAAVFIDSLVKTHAEGTYIIVTHKGCIRNMLAHLLGMTVEGTWRYNIVNCGIARVEIHDGYAVLTLLNG